MDETVCKGCDGAGEVYSAIMTLTCGACGGSGKRPVDAEAEELFYIIDSEMQPNECIERIRAALDAAKRSGMVEAAKKYGTHKSGCYSERDFERECDCGLYALRGPRG
jgi:predicted transposase YbfD/YdcC